MFRHDLGHSGYTTSDGPSSSVEKLWSFHGGIGLPKAVQSSLAVVDGVVYVGSDDAFVYALKQTILP